MCDDQINFFCKEPDKMSKDISLNFLKDFSLEVNVKNNENVKNKIENVKNKLIENKIENSSSTFCIKNLLNKENSLFCLGGGVSSYILNLILFYTGKNIDNILTQIVQKNDIEYFKWLNNVLSTIKKSDPNFPKVDIYTEKILLWMINNSYVDLLDNIDINSFSCISKFPYKYFKASLMTDNVQIIKKFSSLKKISENFKIKLLCELYKNKKFIAFKYLIENNLVHTISHNIYREIILNDDKELFNFLIERDKFKLYFNFSFILDLLENKKYSYLEYIISQHKLSLSINLLKHLIKNISCIDNIKWIFPYIVRSTNLNVKYVRIFVNLIIDKLSMYFNDFINIIISCSKCCTKNSIKEIVLGKDKRYDVYKNIVSKL